MEIDPALPGDEGWSLLQFISKSLMLKAPAQSESHEGGSSADKKYKSRINHRGR
jgi:hypothetical protein